MVCVCVDIGLFAMRKLLTPMCLKNLLHNTYILLSDFDKNLQWFLITLAVISWKKFD